MAGNGNHGYGLQEDVNFDELINASAWPPSTDQYAYQHQVPHQGPYAQPYSHQSTYGHYDQQQQSYGQPAYTNSPYASQPQYQHARPSDVFGPTSYNLDPALNGSTGYAADNSFSFGLHGNNQSTISPQNLQYQPAQPTTNRSIASSTFQHSRNDFNQPQHSTFFQNGNFHNPDPSVRYPTLPNAPSNIEQKQQPKLVGIAPEPTRTVTPKQQQVPARTSGNTLRITHPDLIANGHTSSRSQFPYAPFLFWEDTPIQVAPGLKSKQLFPRRFFQNFYTNVLADTLPKYQPRKSRNGKELVPGLDLSRKFPYFA